MCTPFGRGSIANDPAATADIDREVEMNEVATEIDAPGMLQDASGEPPYRQQALRQQVLGQQVVDEELRQAVGQNALLHTQVHRRLTDHLLRLRDEVASLKRDMEALQLQNRHLSCGVARVIELTRAELLHTRQPAGAAQDATTTTAPTIIPRLLSPEKLLSMGANLRVNLGCGLIPIPEYLNVDERELPGVDLIADVRSLPFQLEALTEIYAAHLTEHFTETYLKSTLLPAWHRLLKPSGILRIVVPDAEGMIRAFSQGTYPFENLRTVTYGGQDYPGNFHYTMFSRESLRTILREARFNPGEYSCVARPNGLCLEMEITATKLS
jgi:predicted SAM-dependent methyltransferase